MLGHIVLLYQPYNFLPEYEFAIKTVFGYGHQAVLLFFIVSGFSIAYSSSDLDIYDHKSIRDYFFKRFRRIYPLFFIALLISLIILFITKTQSDIIRLVLSFFFLTDIAAGAISYPIPTNFPIWSLSYEVVYYILFPFLILFYKKIGQHKTFILFLTIGLISGIVGFLKWPNHIFNILQYYWIWIGGAIIADAYLKNKTFRFSFIPGLLVLFVAFMLTIERINIVSDWCWSMFFLTIFLAFFVNKEQINIQKKLLNLLIGLVSVSICYYLTYFNIIVIHSDLLRYVLIGLGFSSLLLSIIPLYYFKNLSRYLIKPFVFSGSYSYALYIIHWPLIMLSVFLYKMFEGGSVSLMVFTITINIFLIFMVSRYLELGIQPWIAKILNKYYYRRSVTNSVAASITSR